MGCTLTLVCHQRPNPSQVLNTVTTDNFEHLIPRAHTYNLRLVIVQRKDYSGSSEYTDAEMATLEGDPPAFFQGVGLTLARFVYYLIQNTPVCKPSEDRSKGGIGIAGWSLGAIHAMAMFAGLNGLDSLTYSAIMPYVYTLTLYGNTSFDLVLGRTIMGSDNCIQIHPTAILGFHLH